MKQFTNGIRAEETVLVDTNGNIVTPGAAPATPVTSAISGQITVTTAGTAVQGPDVALTNGAYIHAIAANTGVVYFGNDGAGDVSSANGYELEAGKTLPSYVANLNQLWFDAAVNGSKFSWIMG